MVSSAIGSSTNGTSRELSEAHLGELGGWGGIKLGEAGSSGQGFTPRGRRHTGQAGIASQSQAGRTG